MIRVAVAQDDAGLRACARIPMRGSVSVAFETEPSFFGATAVQGDAQVLIAERDGVVIGMGVRAVRTLYVGGKPQQIGYLSGLRGSPALRQGTALARGYRLLRELDKDGRVPYYLTTIIDDNRHAQDVLLSSRAGLPAYRHCGDLRTLLLRPRKSCPSSNVTRGAPAEEIVSYLNSIGADKDGFPHLLAEDFGTPRLHSLTPKDFYVVRSGADIDGLVALWDQRSFKQTRIAAYAPLLAAARPLANALAPLTGSVHLPAAGSTLRHAYLAFALAEDPRPLSEAIGAALNDAVGRFDALTIGFEADDPLVTAALSYSAREYRSRIYTVSFDGDHSLPHPHLEVATL